MRDVKGKYNICSVPIGYVIKAIRDLMIAVTVTPSMISVRCGGQCANKLVYPRAIERG
jgi:hypothetical protein